MMLYCEKTKPLLAIPIDLSDELLQSGRSEHNSDQLIEDVE